MKTPLLPIAAVCLLSSLAVARPGHAAPPWPTRGSAGTLIGRFEPPPKAQRVAVEPGSFAAWLRELPLRPAGTQVLLHSGNAKHRQDVHAAVIDIDTGKRDLQQCADAVMRLRAEYLWSKNRPGQACFLSAAGKTLRFGGKGYPAYRKWLDTVYNWANTGSLRQQMQPVRDALQVQPGDVYVMGAGGGLPYGHAVLVLDVAQEPGARGQRWVQLSQSYMPAQDIHVLQNGAEPKVGPWFRVQADGSLGTPEWIFKAGSLHRFGPKECAR
jgi:hypothetical protein